MQERIYPSAVAHGQGPVKLVLRPQGRDRFAGNLRIQPHLVKIIPRRKRGKKQRKDRYADKEKCGLHQPVQEVAHYTARGICAAALSLGVAAIKRRVTSCSGARHTFSGWPSATH